MNRSIVRNRAQIDWLSLPKTFQEAILVVLSLGLEYIWIDSLCIIQDDAKDWHRQAAKMMDIYSRAFLTIAATKSTSIDGGLFSLISPKYEAKVLTSALNTPAGQALHLAWLVVAGLWLGGELLQE